MQSDVAFALKHESFATRSRKRCPASQPYDTGPDDDTFDFIHPIKAPESVCTVLVSTVCISEPARIGRVGAYPFSARLIRPLPQGGTPDERFNECLQSGYKCSAMKAATIPLSEIARESWDGARAHPRTPMRQYIWARAYEETLARGDVRAMFVGPQAEPLAIAPFAEPASGPRRQVLLGAEDLWESIEVAAPDEGALKQLAEQIAHCGIPLRFGHHPTDTRFLELLRYACRGKAHVIVSEQPMKAMPHIELDASWVEPESHFNSRRRSDFRRMARRAEQLGKITYEIISPHPETLDDLLDEAFAVEESSWKGRSGTAISQDHRTEAFYRAYAKRAMEDGILRLCFMRIDGKAAAMQFAVECENRFWLIKVGYDDAFKRVSPGNLLMRETISYAATRGLEAYEFLGKEAEWTRLWAGDARPIATLRTYPYNFSGAAAFLSDGWTVAKKRVAEKLSSNTGANYA